MPAPEKHSGSPVAACPRRPRLVMKFGGTSVADRRAHPQRGRHVKREVDAGYEVAVVVSAMAGKTNELVGWCSEAAAALRRARIRRGRRLRRAGDLRPAGHRAAGHGRQGPLLAGLADPDPDRPTPMARRASSASTAPTIVERLRRRARSRSSPASRASSQRPAASPRSAAAARIPARWRIAAAIEAERCDIYTDVDGVYTTDPRIVPKARRLDKVAFEEMLEMASLGAKVLQVRSVELAMVHRVRTYRALVLRRSRPRSRQPGTLICDEEDIVEQQVVTGIAYSKDEAQITLRRVADKPGVAAAIFVPLAEANINVDMIVQNISEDGATTDITFTVPHGRLRARLRRARQAPRATIGYDDRPGRRRTSSRSR